MLERLTMPKSKSPVICRSFALLNLPLQLYLSGIQKHWDLIVITKGRTLFLINSLQSNLSKKCHNSLNELEFTI